MTTPNNLGVLIPTLIGSIQEVARSSGFIFNAVDLDPTLEAAAKGQTVTYPELPDSTAGDVTPGVDAPDDNGTTPTAPSCTLSLHKYAPFKVTAEDNRAMAARGGEYRSRSIDTAIAAVLEPFFTDVAGLMVKNAGLVHGTPGTAPFATNPNLLVDAWQTMADDKAPDSGRIAVLSTNDYAGASKLTQFQHLSTAPVGTDFATGRLGMLSNWMTGYDQASGVHQSTTANGGNLVNNAAGYAAGTKVIAYDTGDATFAAGDVVTIAGNYIKGTTTLAQMVVASATGTAITLTRGLLSAVADNAAIVRLGSHYSSILAHRAATYYTIRPSAEVPEGDKATFRTVVRDPVTKIALRLAYYPQFHQGSWHVSAVGGGIVRRPSWIRRLIA